MVPGVRTYTMKFSILTTSPGRPTTRLITGGERSRPSLWAEKKRSTPSSILAGKDRPSEAGSRMRITSPRSGGVKAVLPVPNGTGRP